MESVDDTSMPEVNSTEEESVDTIYQADGSSSSNEKTSVKNIHSSKSLHDQLKKTRQAFENLKNSIIESTTAITKNFNELKAKEERFSEISRKIASINFESAIKLNVGGNVYETSLETLTKHPESLVTEMFSSRFNLKQSNDGCYFIDREGKHFHHILNYLRSGKAPSMSILNTDSEEILDEAEYYGLIGLIKAINKTLNPDNDNNDEVMPEDNDGTGSNLVDETGKKLCATEEKLNSCLNLLEGNVKVLDEAIRQHKEVTMKLSNFHFGEPIELNVGGRRFTTLLKTLRREPQSVLALMFSGKYDQTKGDDGSFFIDRDGTFFHHILTYLRDGKLSENVIEQCGPEMQQEAEFYGLSGLKELIHNYSLVKLIVGDREFTVTRKILEIYPGSMFGRIVAGIECAFEKRQDGAFCIERNARNFHHILEYLRLGTMPDDAIKECGLSLLEDAVFYMLPGLEERIYNYNNVRIDVGGKEFVIRREVLSHYYCTESFFVKMLKGKKGNYIKRNDGSYFIDRDPSLFPYVLNYLKNPQQYVRVDSSIASGLGHERLFYDLPFLTDYVRDY